MTGHPGITTADNMKLILDVCKYLRNSGFVIQPPGNPGQTTAPETMVYFRNDSGVVVPPFACIQSTGTVESGGQNYVTADKPADTSGAAGGYFFNSIAEVEVDGYGIAYAGPFVRSMKSGTTASGGKCRPTVDEWYLTVDSGGQFIMIGDDDIGTDIIRVQIPGGAGGTNRMQGRLKALRTAGNTGPDAKYTGLNIGTVEIAGAACAQSSLIGTQVDVVDHSGCVFDHPFVDLDDVWVWASEQVFASLDAGAPENTLTPCHWVADDRCCVSADVG